jgi:hypothetical protein
MKMAKISSEINRAAVIWGIEADVKKIQSIVAKELTQKEASFCDNNYALVIEHKGQTLRKFPIKTAAEVFDGCDYFIRNEEKYPFSWRRQICSNIMKRAAELKIEPSQIPDKIGEWVDSRFPDLQFFAEEIERRKLLLTGEMKEAADALVKVAEAGQAMGADEFNPKTMDSLIELLLDFDKMAGLTVHYGHRLLNPVSSLLRHNPEKIAALVDVVELNGYTVPVKDLLALPTAKYAELFGDDFAKSLVKGDTLDAEKVRAVLPTLPAPDVQALLSAMA